MRLVGDAVAEESDKHGIFERKNGLVVIGIASWGKVAMRSKLIVENKVGFYNYYESANYLHF